MVTWGQSSTLNLILGKQRTLRRRTFVKPEKTHQYAKSVQTKWRRMIQRRNKHIFSGKEKAGGVMSSDDDENSGRKTLGESRLRRAFWVVYVYILLLINMW